MSWFPCPHVDQRRTCSTFTSSCQGPQASLCLAFLETVKSSAEISRIFKEGKRSSNRFLTLIVSCETSEYLRADADPEHGLNGRVAFIAGKKNGNACWRNAAKRRMREIARQLGAPWAGFDVLFVAKRALTDASYSKVSSTTAKTLQELDLRKPDAREASEDHQEHSY